MVGTSAPSAVSAKKLVSPKHLDRLRLNGQWRFNTAELGLSFHHHLPSRPLVPPASFLRPATFSSLDSRISLPRNAWRGGIGTPPSAELWLAHPFLATRGNEDAFATNLSQFFPTASQLCMCVRCCASEPAPPTNHGASRATVTIQRLELVGLLSRICPGSCALERLSCFRLIAPPLFLLRCLPLAAPQMTSGY